MPSDLASTPGNAPVVVGADVTDTAAPAPEPAAKAVVYPIGNLVAPPPVRRAPRVVRFIDASRRPPVETSVIERLRSSDALRADRWISWLVTAVITLVGGLIRLYQLNYPPKILFDETYYAKGAWSLLQLGYEGSWAEGSSEAFAAGDWSGLSTTNADFAVHPPLSKWLIAVGLKIFGLNSFGWRFSSWVFGTLLILVTIRLTRRVSHSTLIGGLAGLLMCVDGLCFVMSRLALLDIFQSFFIVAAVGAVIADRDWFRVALAKRLQAQQLTDFGGTTAGGFIVRPWLVAAGLLFGAACACKWNSMYPLAVFAVCAVVWSVTARKLAGGGSNARVRRRADGSRPFWAGLGGKHWWSLLIDGVPAFFYMVVLAVITYVASWWSWFKTSGGYLRQWGAENPDAALVRRFGPTIASWLEYQRQTLAFHTGDYINSVTHTYAAPPIGWLLLGRNIGIDAVNDIKPGVDGCNVPEGQTCLRVIDGLGTPLIWWGAALALLAALVWWLAGRDWRFSVPVLGMASTWIPWFFAGTRPLFLFYAITIIPFTIMGLAMAIGVIIGPAEKTLRRRKAVIGCAIYVVLCVANFIFMWPILTDQLMTHQHWTWRMWFPFWI